LVDKRRIKEDYSQSEDTKWNQNGQMANILTRALPIPWRKALFNSGSILRHQGLIFGKPAAESEPEWTGSPEVPEEDECEE
jgi:hypothetical protein